MYCPKCGAENSRNNFCVNCGTKILSIKKKLTETNNKDEVNRSASNTFFEIIETSIEEATFFDEIKGIFKSFFNKQENERTWHAFDDGDPFLRADEELRQIIYGKDNNISEDVVSLINEENIKCGEIANCYSCFEKNLQDNRLYVFYTLTKGIAYITPSDENNNSLVLGSAAAAGVVGAVISMAVKGLVEKNKVRKLKKFNKYQQLIIDKTDKYPVSLVAKCYPDGIFIPYEKINYILVDKNKLSMVFVFGDVYSKRLIFGFDDFYESINYIEKFSKYQK